MYITSVDGWPQLHNRAFGEVSFSTLSHTSQWRKLMCGVGSPECTATPAAAVCDGAVVLGVLTSSSSSSSSSMVLNPPDNFIVKPGDQLCVVAKDKTPHAFKVREAPACLRTALPMPESGRALSERKPNQELLICNWRDDMEDVSTRSWAQSQMPCQLSPWPASTWPRLPLLLVMICTRAIAMLCALCARLGLARVGQKSRSWGCTNHRFVPECRGASSKT